MKVQFYQQLLCYNILWVMFWHGSIFMRSKCQALEITENKNSRFGTSAESEANFVKQKLQDASSTLHVSSSYLEPDHMIVHPTRVDHEGRFISHDVKHFTHDLSDEEHSRKRRSIDSNRDPHLYFKIPLTNEELTLNVSGNQQILHSNFIVERLRKKHAEEEEESFPHLRSSIQRGTNWPCHFRGHVLKRPNSMVAISTCNGLMGLIRLKEGDFFIEPLLTDSTSQSQKQAHKIYKREAAGVYPSQEKSTSSSRSGNPERGNGTSKSSGNKNPKSLKTETKPKTSRRKEDTSDTNDGFCGVTDTDRRYRRALRDRERWEARRARSNPMTSSERIRRRRSLSLEHWVEVMVVVDRKMTEYYEAYHEGEVERYVLTIINMVSQLFHDVSIGNSLHISLIRLIILEGEEDTLKVTSHAEKTLDNFCRWAKRMNPRSDHHGNHHDVAVLLTRKNICSKVNASCETLGLAHVAGMCQSHRSCNVNQDTGLSLAFTVAHELGHNFAMHHDGQHNSCKPDVRYSHVMAPHLTSNSSPMKWSPCSRRYVTRFLDRNWGFCLMDIPTSDQTSFHFPSDLPGVLYNADHQCRLMFGPHSKHCKGMGNICHRLWCLHKGNCRSRLHAAAPGTKCAPGRWCYAGKCARVGRRPTAVDGSWSSWSKWSRCSRTCGVGISFSARYCNQPAPQHGGKYCLGERKRYRTCNAWNCPKKNVTISFRSEQCSAFNNVPYRNKTYVWLPVDSPVYPCELHCYTRDSDHPFADRLRDKVVDGTKCFSQGRDICVDGICKHLGCDMRIDSMASEDKCGVCGGDGSSCSQVNTSFTLPLGDEYVAMTILPKGARNIQINEVESSGNFLALRNPLDENEFYLNGNYMIQWDLQFELADTVFNYKRTNKTQDNITAEGPISHDILVMLLFVEENPGINISYIMPHNVTAVFQDDRPTFTWMMQPWSGCSRTCGNGFQLSRAICVEKKAGIVEEDFCDEDIRPMDRRRTCPNPDCAPEWLAGPWQDCSVTCGGGIGRQSRTVLCIRSVNDNEQVVLNKTECSDVIEPSGIRSCSTKPHTACPTWRTGSWSDCSASCGHGTRNRSVQCVRYIIDDVISIKDKADFLDDDATELHSVDYNDANNGMSVPRHNRPMTLKQGTTVKRRRKKNLLEKFDFDVEDEEECGVGIRPRSTKPCNTKKCSTLSARDFALDLSVSAQRRNANGSLKNIDEDFDVVEDLSPDSNTSWKHREDPQDNEYQDLIDQITYRAVVAQNKTSNSSLSSDDPRNSSAPDEETQSLHPATHAPTATTRSTTTLKPKWLTGVWGQCSTTCGVGAKIRNVVCSGGEGSCDSLAKPAPAQRCNLKPCAVWQYAGWSRCSKKCGKGRRKRKVVCKDSRIETILRPYHCNSLPKLPRINASCNIRRCLPWRTSRWSMCNVTCGPGTQRRRVACSKIEMCELSKRPVSQKNCMLRECVEWRVSHWGRCPVNCGYGIKRRYVKCVEKLTGKPSTKCNLLFKPERVKKCNKGPCRVTDFDFTSCNGDRLKPRFCKVLKQWGKCVQPSLAIQCCTTCQTFVSVRRKAKIS